MNARTALMPLVCLLTLTYSALAQSPVDARNRYQHVFAIVPLMGAGTRSDPKRPLYAPTRAEMSAHPRKGILGFSYVISDDGHFALVDFMAQDKSAFKTILGDPAITAFAPAKANAQDIQTAFKKLKKDFSLNQFGLRLP